MNDLIREELEAFDRQFGKAGPDKNCDSEGRSAGCDDCSDNIEVREEHKAFLERALPAAYRKGREDAVSYFDLKADVIAVWNNALEAAEGALDVSSRAIPCNHCRDLVLSAIRGLRK